MTDMSDQKLPNLREQVDKIESREDLGAFVTNLLNDLRENPHEWENHSLPWYIEAIGAVVASKDGYYLNTKEPVPEQPTWRMMAEILFYARYYE